MAKPQHTPIPRYRAFAGPALLTQGFRPFFLAAGIWALAALALSFAMIRGRLELPTYFDPIAWHYHELLFGYVAATIGGFLLTAIPNWTGRLPLQGWPLLALFALWLAGRLAVLFASLLGPVAALIDLSFLAALTLISLREVIAGRNWRNLVPIGAVALLLVANAAAHGAALGLDLGEAASKRLPIAVVILLISLIGGRVVPSFTRNWLAKRGETRLPAAFGRLDRLALALTLLALAAWVALPDAAPVAVLLGFAAVLQLVRLARWRGWRTGAEALVWVLHLAYLWLPVGLGLLSASHWLVALPQSGAVHALTAGAIGSMTLAVMSRAILGHTGRELHAGPGLTAVYLLVTLAAVCRVAAGLAGAWYETLLVLAAAAWIASFLGFLAVMGPMLFGSRPRAT